MGAIFNTKMEQRGTPDQVTNLQMPPGLAKPPSQYDNTKIADYAEMLRSKYQLNNKILLVQVPQFNFQSFNAEVARNRGYYAYPPTGLQCLAKAISHRGLDIDILDLNYELLKRISSDKSFNYLKWLDILDEYIAKNDPAIIGATCISVSEVFTGVHPFTNLLEHLSKKNERIVIGGGVIATNEFENYLNMGLCHFITVGESENKINFLLDNLFERSGYAPTPGIYFKFHNKIEQTTGPRDTVTLKGSLVDTYKLVPIEEYNKVGSLNPYSRLAGQDTRFATIQLVRGCRANCRFCGVTKFMGKGTRYYPPRDLLEEISYLVKERGVRHFEWLDDDLLVCREAVKGVLAGMAELRKKYPITWSANNGLIANSLDEELLALMRDSGCLGFRIGVESGNDEMLRKIRKPATIATLKRAAGLINKFPEMFIGANYIIGLFGEETFGQMLDTFKFSYDLNLDWSSFTTFQFTSKETILQEQLKVHSKEVREFIPAKDSAEGEIDGKGIVTGPEVFNLPKDFVPPPEQVKQVWFAFNLVGNYIHNKNLKPGGSPKKFTSWVEMVQVVYPHNPYMPLFAGLGNILLGNKTAAERQLELTKRNLKISEYWKRRFGEWGLVDLVNNFPKNPEGAQEALESLQRKYSTWI